MSKPNLPTKPTHKDSQASLRWHSSIFTHNSIFNFFPWDPSNGLRVFTVIRLISLHLLHLQYSLQPDEQASCWDGGEGENGSVYVRLRDEVEEVVMKQAWAQISDMCVCMCVSLSPGEAITTLGFGAQCVYVESAAVSSYQCSWTAFSLGIYSNSASFFTQMVTLINTGFFYFFLIYLSKLSTLFFHLVSFCCLFLCFFLLLPTAHASFSLFSKAISV